MKKFKAIIRLLFSDEHLLITQTGNKTQYTPPNKQRVEMLAQVVDKLNTDVAIKNRLKEAQEILNQN